MTKKRVGFDIDWLNDKKKMDSEWNFVIFKRWIVLVLKHSMSLAAGLSIQVEYDYM